MTNPNTQAVVTRQVRETAAVLFYTNVSASNFVTARMQAGELDDHWLIQALSAHTAPPADAEMLRTALIACANATDGFATSGVTDDFLMHVPAEVEACINGLRTKLAAAEAEIADLKQRGGELVIAYNVAICSPKGVVPDDRFYDQDIASSAEREFTRAALGETA
jgi:hypothetical protein